MDLDITYIANLARIELPPEELIKLDQQLPQILEYVAKLNSVDVANVEPTAHPFPMNNVTRADEVRPSLPNEVALANAPAQANGLFVVPKIVE